MISIIGGSGFIGDRLCALLEGDSQPFINIDINEPTRFKDHFHRGDVRDLSNDEKVFEKSDHIINLAAKHKDNVLPIELYYDVNVGGAKETVRVAEKYGISKIIFTSSAAVYGLHNEVVTEDTQFKPFNHYGKSKLKAEEVYLDWQKRTGGCLIMIRPTVVFGEGNRGNVYNLLRQLNEGNFLMVGDGKNRKSMAYVGNMASFINYCSENVNEGLHIFNYSDGPDMTMNALVELISRKLNKDIPSARIPYVLGLLGGYGLDLISFLIRKEFSISSVRVKKFCANTQFSSARVEETGFKREYSLLEGLEQTLNYEFGNLALSH